MNIYFNGGSNVEFKGTAQRDSATILLEVYVIDKYFLSNTSVNVRQLFCQKWNNDATFD